MPFDTNPDLLIKAEYPSVSPAAPLQHQTPQVLTDDTQASSHFPDLAAHQLVATSEAPLKAAADQRSTAMLGTQSVQQALQSVPAIDQPAVALQTDPGVYSAAANADSALTQDHEVKSVGTTVSPVRTPVAEQVTPALSVTSTQLSSQHLLPKQRHSEGSLQPGDEPETQHVAAGKHCQLFFPHLLM